MHHTIFYVSDGTGITVETLGNTLLTQFQHFELRKIHHPYIDSDEKIKAVAEEIDQTAKTDHNPPIVFNTLVVEEHRKILGACEALHFDLFDLFIKPMEENLGLKSNRGIGRSHGIGVFDTYKSRIDAIHFAMVNDDGSSVDNYASSDVIMLGVSRCGKTPTCIYLALNYGIHAANYPLTTDDLNDNRLPEFLRPHRKKIYGLSINPNRLHQIREERRPNSKYATLSQCQYEVRTALSLFQKEKIPYLDTSTISIEEIAAYLMQQKQLKRRINS